MLTPHGYTFSVNARGQKWRGTWEKIEGDVCVSSAFGSERRKLGRRKPELVAQEIMTELVDNWVRTQRGYSKKT